MIHMNQKYYICQVQFHKSFRKTQKGFSHSVAGIACGLVELDYIIGKFEKALFKNSAPIMKHGFLGFFLSKIFSNTLEPFLFISVRSLCYFFSKFTIRKFYAQYYELEFEYPSTSGTQLLEDFYASPSPINCSRGMRERSLFVDNLSLPYTGTRHSDCDKIKYIYSHLLICLVFFFFFILIT